MKQASIAYMLLSLLLMPACNTGQQQAAGPAGALPDGWQRFDLPRFCSIYTLAFDSSGSGWAGGERGSLFRFNGSNWAETQQPGGEQLFALQALDDTTAAAVGSAGTVLLCRDGIWQQTESDLFRDIMDLCWIDSNNGWAVGENSLIIQLQRSGDRLTWKLHEAPEIGYLTRVYFTAPENGWAVGNSGLILHWDGTGWRKSDSPTAQNLYGLFFVSAEEGWAAGAYGTILHYRDGAWKQIESPVENHLLDIHFDSDSRAGWIVGASGVLLQWRDGSWQETDSPSPKSLYTITTDSFGNVWASGKGGKIYKKAAPGRSA